MLRNALFIARWELRTALRQKETLLWTFVMPLVFFYFIGTVTGGFSGGGGDAVETLVLERGERPGFLAEGLVRRLEQNEFRVVAPGTPEAEGRSRHLALPDGLTDGALAGELQTLHFRRQSGGLGAEFDEFRIARAMYTTLADLVVSAELDGQPSAESMARLAEAPRSLTLEVRPAGERKRIPTGFEQAVPGTTVMFTLILLLTSGAVAIVIERRTGLLRRLAASPLSRGEIVLGKWIGSMALGVVQVGFGVIAGTLLFGMDWGPAWPMVMVVLFAWASMVSALALLAGSFARSEGQAVALGVLSANVLAALGGCWWPIEVTPAWMQKLALFLPTGWAMDAIHRLAIFQHGAASALPHVFGLGAATLILGWGAARAFRYE